MFGGAGLVDGSGKTAVVFGGFGFQEKQMAKHAALYDAHGFDVITSMGSIKDLTTPATAARRGAELAERVLAKGQPVVAHAISGSVWTMVYMLEALGQGWRDEHVRALAFDSCPPKSDIYAFGGFVAFRFGNPALKNIAAPFFQPYRALCGIDDAWEAENHARMFGAAAVIPRAAQLLFMHGRNDPVLDGAYVASFVADCRERALPGATIAECTFERSRHSMAVVEHPKDYKHMHVEQLLRKVPEWNMVGAGHMPTSAGRDYTLDVLEKAA